MTNDGTFRRCVAASLLSVQLAACTAWHVETIAPAEVLATRHPAEVRVTRPDARRLVIYQPRLVGDQLEGLRSVSRAFQPAADSVRVPLAEVSALATRRVSVGRTLLAASGGLVIAVVVGAFTQCRQGGMHPVSKNFRGRALILLMTSTVIATGRPADAQAPATHKGFWIGLAMGPGTSAVQCGGCVDQGTRSGIVFLAPVLWGVSEHAVLGLEAGVWISGWGAFTESTLNQAQHVDVSGVVYIYPHTHSGLFLKAGFSVSGYRVSAPPLDRTAIAQPGALVGIGWNLRLSRQIHLTPLLQIAGAYLGRITEENERLQRHDVATNASQFILGLGIGVMFHPSGPLAGG
jgi:hypothetical protein